MTSAVKERVRLDELRIEAKSLATAMKNAAAIVENRNTIPILANVRLIAERGNMELVTSDLDVEYRQNIAVDPDCTLAVTVDAKRLAMLCATVDGNSVLTMAVKEGRLFITAGRSRWHLPIIPVTDFPDIPAPVATGEIIMGGAELSAAIGRVIWAASTEQVRYYLNGVFFHTHDGNLAMAATNASWGAALETAIPNTLPEIIAAPKFLNALSSVAGAHNGQVSLAWDDRKVRAVIGDITLTGKVIDGSFPDYRRVIPAPVESPVVFDPETMADALRRVNVVTDGLTRSITMRRGEGSLSISASSSRSGDAGEEVPAEVSGDFATGIDGGALASAINAIGGDTIELHQVDGQSVMMFRRAVPDGMCVFIGAMHIQGE